MTDKQEFLQEVGKHRMEVLHEDGIYRHLRFAEPGSLDKHFDLVTYPMHLVYSGDMGSFVFSRTHDMTEFFKLEGEPDLRYWAEKLVAVDRGGHEKYSEDAFRRKIADHLDDMGACAELRQAVEYGVLPYAGEESGAHEAAMDFVFKGEYIFQDFWEYDCRELTDRYRWACYAIQWGLGKYWEGKA